MNRLLTHSKKVAIGIVGGLVTLIGLIMVPYPGPGWLVVFAGLAILSTEFEFASRTLLVAREKYNNWIEWVRRQPLYIRIPILLGTGFIVLMTVWLVNGFGILASIFGLDDAWLVSPLFR